MRVVALTLAGLAGLTIPALAQAPAGDVAAQLQAAEAPEEQAGLLEDLFAEDPNGFIHVLQDELRARGFRDAAPTGQFTIETIRQLNAFCAETGIADICRRGPLVPEGVAAIAGALYASSPDAPSPAVEVPEPVRVPAPRPETDAAAGATEPASGPLALAADRSLWVWHGMEVAGDPAMATAPIDLRRTGIYDPTAEQWLVGPLDYEPAADGSHSIDFTTPAAGGPVRIYPLRGRDNQRWLYTVVEGLDAGADYRASWTVTMDGDAYRVTDLVVMRR